MNSSHSPKDAIDFLKTDHRAIDDLFIAAQKDDDFPVARLETVMAFKEVLLPHLELEERVFYSTCARYPALKDIIEESLDEHQMIKDLLVEMTNERSVEELEALYDKLAELVSRHIDEEESEVFPLVREQLEQEQLDRLGAEMARERGPVASAKAA